MRSFDRGEEPVSLRKARKELRRWEELSENERGIAVKNDVRRTLFKAQRGCCAYCEARLGESVDDCDAHIEHLQRRADKPQLAFDWSNIFLSCNSRESCGKYKDEKRVKFDVADFVDPSREDPQDFFEYSYKNGQIFAKCANATVKRRAEETIRVLNLDRSRKLQSIRRGIALIVADFIATGPSENEVRSFLTDRKDCDCFSVYCFLLGRKTQDFDR